MITVNSNLLYKVNVQLSVDSKPIQIKPGKNQIVNAFADSMYAEWSCFTVVANTPKKPVEAEVEVETPVEKAPAKKAPAKKAPAKKAPVKKAAK